MAAQLVTRCQVPSRLHRRPSGLASVQPQRAVARLLPPAPLLQGRQLAAAAPGGRLLQARGRAAVAVAAAAGAGEVCVVTGASQGIGKCIALELGRVGCKVVINYRDGSNQADAEGVAAEVAALGGEAMVVQGDMGKLEEIENIYAQAVERFGTVDVVVNNAGITRDTLIMKMKPEQWQQVIDINLTAVFYNCQAALKVMSKKKKGRIVNIASVVGLVGNAGQANYSAAKGGVISMTKTIAREYAGRGITANCVAPGFIDTAMTAKIDEKYQEGILKGIPMGRMGTPQEVAGMVRFLALDPAAAYITGQCVAVDGGMTM